MHNLLIRQFYNVYISDISDLNIEVLIHFSLQNF